MVEAGDRADHQHPSRQRQKRQGYNFRFVSAGLEEAAIVPASGEAAQKGVGINAGGWIDEHVGFVVSGGTQLQLYVVEPAGGCAGLRRRRDRSRYGCGIDGVSVRRL